MRKTLRLYTTSNKAGILVCPEKTEKTEKAPGQGRSIVIRVPDSRRRVFLKGDPDIRSLSTDQLNALIELAFRNPLVRETATLAIFYDAEIWARCKRYKRVLRHTWSNKP